MSLRVALRVGRPALSRHRTCVARGRAGAVRGMPPRRRRDGTAAGGGGGELAFGARLA